jgi:uncharacterized protein DUF1993
MSFSMSQASLPAFEISLNALLAILDKAAAFAAAKKIDPSVLLNTRLAPDMFPLIRQVQVATDLAKNGAARLAGVEPPRYEDNETTIDELKARLAKTVAFIKTLDSMRIDAAAIRPIVVMYRHVIIQAARDAAGADPAQRRAARDCFLNPREDFDEVCEAALVEPAAVRQRFMTGLIVTELTELDPELLQVNA